MDSFYRVVAIAGAIVVVASVLLTIVRLQGERPFSSLSALLAGVGAAGSLAVYMLVLDMALKDAWVIGLIAGGGVVGAFVGLKIPLYSRDGVVFSRAAGWHLAPPGLAVAALQVSGVRESPDGAILSLGAVYAATAFAVVASVLLLLRRIARGAAPQVAGQPVQATGAPPETSSCGSCGAFVRPESRFCMSCGAAVEVRVKAGR